MFSRIAHHLPHYFRRPLGRSLEALYVAVGLQDFALAMMIVFEPVYLYRIGFSISSIALFYAIVYFAYVFLIPLGGKLVARFGPTRIISVSTVFLVLYYITVLGIQNYPGLYWIAPFIFAIQKCLFWPGYHTDFLRGSDQGERGKEFSGLLAISTVVYIIGPAVGGMIITWFGFATLFVLGSIIILLANLPLLLLHERPTPERFSYRDSFFLPFQKQHRRTTFAYLGFGEQLLLVYIWPIYLALTFTTIERLGWLTALAMLLSSIVTLLVGRVFDSGHWHHVLRRGAWISAINWILRPVLHSTPMVFASNVFGMISQNMTWVTLSDVAYERALREQNPIGRSILLEQGLSFGKIIAALLVALLSLALPPFPTAFIVGGVFSLIYLRFR